MAYMKAGNVIQFASIFAIIGMCHGATTTVGASNTLGTTFGNTKTQAFVSLATVPMAAGTQPENVTATNSSSASTIGEASTRAKTTVPATSNVQETSSTSTTTQRSTIGSRINTDATSTSKVNTDTTVSSTSSDTATNTTVAMAKPSTTVSMVTTDRQSGTTKSETIQTTSAKNATNATQKMVISSTSFPVTMETTTLLMTTTEFPYNATEEMDFEKDLVEMLKSKASPSARPFTEENPLDPLEIRVDLLIESVKHMNMEHQVVDAMIVYALVWKDPRLKWESEDYGKIAEIDLAHDVVWTPDVVIENRAVDTDTGTTGKVFVTSDGEVTWIMEKIISLKCPLHLFYFPFDTQFCPVMFRVNTHTSNQVVLSAGQISDDMGGDKHLEWDLENVTSAANATKVWKRSYANLAFTMELKRLPRRFIYIILFPMSVFTLLSLVMFIIPPGTAEKVLFALLTHLTFYAFVNFNSGEIPLTGVGVPVIYQYITETFTRLFIGIILSVWLNSIHYKGELGKPLGGVLRGLALECLSNVVCLRSQARKVLEAQESGTTRAEEFELTSIPSVRSDHDRESSIRKDKEGDGKLHSRLTLVEILKSVQEFHKSALNPRTEKQKLEQYRQEWRLAARVINRFCFLLYLIFSVVLIVLAVLQWQRDIFILSSLE